MKTEKAFKILALSFESEPAEGLGRNRGETYGELNTPSFVACLLVASTHVPAAVLRQSE